MTTKHRSSEAPKAAASVRLCDFIGCGEPAKVRVTPERGPACYACEGHEERAVVESGSGFVQEI